MLDNYLVTICAPTLASMKSASLFNCKCQEGEDLDQIINEWNVIYRPYGLRLCVLRRKSGNALIYLFRISQLRSNLRRPGIIEFLKDCGYRTDGTGLYDLLYQLKQRINSSDDFPHEIGIFLDYPLEDVKGFIENKGQNYKYSGLWKVYGDVSMARRTFDKYKKCRNAYCRLWETGKRSVLQMTVAG